MFLGDRYEVHERLGRGGASTLYSGRDMHTNRTVAIKVLRDSYSSDPDLMARFQSVGSSGHYYAPEQAQGEAITAATDVYGYGIMMYEMLTGQTPFDGDTPVAIAMQHIHDMPVSPDQLNPNIPPSLEAIILRCLEKVPERRYQDGSQLARALKEKELDESDIRRFHPIPSQRSTAGAVPFSNEFATNPQKDGEAAIVLTIHL